MDRSAPDARTVIAKIRDGIAPTGDEIAWFAHGIASGAVSVDDVLVLPGQRVERDETLLVLETGKVALDIPSPYSGTIVELFVAAGDPVAERQLVMTLRTD